MTNLIDVIHLSKRTCAHPIAGNLAYATKENFIGRIINGYHRDATDICLLTPRAANALCEVQNYLNKQHNWKLFIYDSYRPKRAVMDFFQWSNLPPADEYELVRKALHYPHIEKNQLFAQGYIAEDSQHCYGHTVDLVPVDMANNQFIEMGAIFDFMDEKSHLTRSAQEIGALAYQHRQILVEAMVKFGFEPYEKEFWHFSHGGDAGREVKNPMDIEITANLRGS